MQQKPRILFVDDEKRVLNSMRGLLRREYELFLTCEGAEAVKLAAEHDVDVIVADQRMPGMTGVEVLAKVKQNSPRTVRVLLTGYADPGAVEGSINEGEVFRFLSKPCPPTMLRETLSLAVEASRTAPAAAEPPPVVAPPAAEPAPPAPPAVPEAPELPTLAADAEPAIEPEPPVLPTVDIDPAIEPETQAVPTPAADVPPAVAAEPPDEAEPPAEPPPATEPEPPVEPPTAAVETHSASPELINDDDETQPSLLALKEEDIAAEEEEKPSHWQTVTSVVMSEDSVEETQETVALGSKLPNTADVGVVVFTIDSDFAATAIRAVSRERNTILATKLSKVAEAIESGEAGVLITDYTTNNTILKKVIAALKQRLPQLVTIIVSEGRDTTDMISLINFGQVFRYVLKPIDPEKLREEINAAVMHHLYLLSNPASAKRHEVIAEAKDAEASSVSVNRFIDRIKNIPAPGKDPADTIS